MLIGIISDLHANLEATLAVFRELDKRKPEKVVCLGDLTGYNASPNEVVDIIRERQIPTVMGNHDAAVCGLEDPWFFRSSAKMAIEWQMEQLRDDNKRWLASAPARIKFNCASLGVHGSPGCRDDYIIDWLDAMRQMEYLDGKDLRICFFGHSHRAALFSEKGAAQSVGPSTVHQIHPGHRYFINPGAVGQPRDRDPRAAFGFYDSEKQTFEFCRVEYDISSCQQRIFDAGLPEDLAFRLAKGK